MKIFIFDQDSVGLPFALSCLDHGHDVRLWEPDPDSLIGKGLVEKVKDWRPSMKWADMIVMTDNSRFGREIEPYFKDGFPIFGCNRKAAQLELDREVGQACLEACGIDTLPFETFESYDKAIDYVKKTGKTYVCKPWGGDPDKSLSYVSRGPADMIFKLQRWKKMNRLDGKFLLQEKIDGIEMAVGGWLGPHGWCAPINENWEEKRLMNGGLGVNTGEMGTTMRYVEKSKLFRLALEPCTEHLIDLGYVGYVDMNCIIDEDGKPWPLEFTMRFGWPHFNLCMTLHKGDPAKWMANLLEGRDTLRVSSDVCLGVVMAHGDFPYGNFDLEDVSGYPITGIKAKTLENLRLTGVQWMEAPVDSKRGVVERETYCTAGDYVAVATGTGPTVSDAREAVYDLAWSIDWPSNRMFRTDLGCRLEEEIPLLQKHGFAEGLEFGDSDE